MPQWRVEWVSEQSVINSINCENMCCLLDMYKEPSTKEADEECRHLEVRSDRQEDFYFMPKRGRSRFDRVQGADWYGYDGTEAC